MVNLFFVIYHLFKFIFLIILGLAALSLVINCLVKWRDVLLFIRGILVKISRRKKQVADEDEDTIGQVFERSGRGRRVHRLPD